MMSSGLESQPAAWEIITGEYPPESGGVSDYTAAVAEGLVHRGSTVRVWQRGNDREAFVDAKGVIQFRCGGSFDGMGLRRLDEELDRFQDRRRLLIQYAPHSFGFKGMNLGFSEWIRRRRFRRGDDVRVMFHEVAYPLVVWPWHHTAMAMVNRWMAHRMVRAASRIYVSTDAWTNRLIRLGAKASQIEAIPIPSNIPACRDQTLIAATRRALSTGDSRWMVGHFGTYGETIARLLVPIVERLLARSPSIHLHLIGGGGPRFRESLVARHRGWEARITASGRLEVDQVATHISACDAMLQPYGDGANTRRTTLMACLVNGRPTVTTRGLNCESIWQSSDSVVLAEPENPDDIVEQLLALLADESRCRLMSQRSVLFYEGHFSIERTLDTLQRASCSKAIESSEFP